MTSTTLFCINDIYLESNNDYKNLFFIKNKFIKIKRIYDSHLITNFIFLILYRKLPNLSALKFV
jgi:hypothetical protein